jgi:PDDEXK-like domain of unknown function (DUF3799)
MIKIDKPGIYYDIAARDYFADPCPEPSLTQSICKILIDQSPAHARLAHPRLNPDYSEPFEYEKRLAIGNAAHKLLIGRGKEVCVIEANDFRTKEAQATRDQTIADGYTPVLAKHMAEARKLVTATREQVTMVLGADYDASFRDGHGEVVAVCQDGDIWLRTMIDWLDGGTCYDLKTSGASAAPHAVPATMASAGWPIQAAMQERILRKIKPGRYTFLFIMVENTEPFALTVNQMSEAVMTLGHKQLDYAIQIWRHCMKTNTWPAYPMCIHEPQYPGYAEQKWLNREIHEAAQERVPRGRAKSLTDLSGG